MKKTIAGADLATRFINLSNEECVNDFIREYRPKLRPEIESSYLISLAGVLRDAWDKKKWAQAEERFDRVFTDQLTENQMRLFRRKPPDEYSKMDRPAVRVRLGQEGPVFEPRDLLDNIAITILKASAHHLLRMCRGHSQGWRCPQPYLVADEHRRVYCYKSCGDQAKSEAKKQWHKEHPGGTLRARARVSRTGKLR